MNLDRNTVLGFIILAALFIGYFIYTNKGQEALRKQNEEKQAREQAIQDSITKLNKPTQDSLNKITDSTLKIAEAGTFQNAVNGTEQLVYAENDVIRVAFTNKGGQPKWVELKNFKNQDSSLVKLAGSDFDKISYTIKTGENKTVQTGDLYFQPGAVVKNSDQTTTITFTLNSKDSASSASITHQFILKKNDYMVDFNILLNGADKLLGQGVMNLTWQYSAAQQESSISFEKQNTQIGYVTGDEFDYHTIAKRSSKDFDKATKWIGIRQRFFFTILVAKNNFSSGKMEWTIPPDEEKKIVQSTSNMKVPVDLSGKVGFNIYYGPSNYHILKKYDMKFEKLVNLGQGMYSFVRPLNRFVVMPIFDFMKKFGSYGLAIALLTIFIRLIISPLTYSSYLSGAKMKVLRPEIAALKAKYGSDQQQMSVEQMKLFREAGVNTLGGCIPALLQIPIFFALFSFFSSEVGLRGASFLWANDLSAPDKVIHFGNIPLISSVLGDHISLFTITAVITSFLISLYSMSMTPDQSNPVLKYMPYIFPVFLLFIFNRLPSALTWYYTVSNIITLALQFVIQNYIIDHNKILAKMAENRKKPKPQSKWQERMQQMQEQQKKLKEAQQKNKR
ncbi:MAG TPA: membrane protein insertase YidC [Chitinophagaceae bacterium]|nr:membrane protein insertase YidC [Chitinophagaceae bacterium]